MYVSKLGNCEGAVCKKKDLHRILIYSLCKTSAALLQREIRSQEATAVGSISVWVVAVVVEVNAVELVHLLCHFIRWAMIIVTICTAATDLFNNYGLWWLFRNSLVCTQISFIRLIFELKKKQKNLLHQMWG
mgnify:CR=1 FL=1